MGKNSTLADTAASLVNSIKDENFKDIIRYKAIAALLVKFTIPEFSEKSLVEIAKAIIDTRERKKELTNSEILEDEVDFIPTEAGTKDEKNTRNDAVFRMRTGNGIAEFRMDSVNNNKITVNTEMQNITSEASLGYDLVSRAIYYGASLLRDTVPAGDTKYTGIHKVYTIWFCNNNLKFETNPNEIPDTEYIHRFGFRRFYSDIQGKVVGAEKASDLIEVVLVELKGLKKSLGTETERLVCDLFYNTGDIVGEIENIENVNLTKVRKGVNEMIDYEARTKARVEEAVAEAQQEVEIAIAVKFIRRQMSKGNSYTLEQAIDLVKDNLMCNEEIAKAAGVIVMREIGSDS